MMRRPPRSTLFPYTTLSRSVRARPIAPMMLPQPARRMLRDLQFRLPARDLGTAVVNKSQGHIAPGRQPGDRSEEHTSELQSQSNLVCRLLLEKKKKTHSTRQVDHKGQQYAKSRQSTRLPTHNIQTSPDPSPLFRSTSYFVHRHVHRRQSRTPH